MEKDENTRPADTSKYNLRCNRNISEKMTKKDFIYDIPAPFQAMRKEKSLPATGLKKSRNEFESLMRSNGIGISQVKSAGGRIGQGSKLCKNPVGLLRLINGQNLMPIMAANIRGKSCIEKSQDQNERIVKEAERDETDKEIRRQIVLPIQIRRKIGSDLKANRYSVISTSADHELNKSSGCQIPERKILPYQCNYCEERLATFLSLSTHVKYHCDRLHCRKCLAILEPEESISQHIEKAHSVNFSRTADQCDPRLPNYA